jgi:aromatic-L-amino-acid decarboxylase
MVLRYFGREGLVARIHAHNRLAQRVADWIDASPDFERLAPVPFSTVCFRAHPARLNVERELDALNERLMQRINENGHFFLSHTRLHGRFTLRIAIGNLRTSEQTLEDLWAELQEILVSELAESGGRRGV